MLLLSHGLGRSGIFLTVKLVLNDVENVLGELRV